MRGLKLKIIFKIGVIIYVATCTGAWIETNKFIHNYTDYIVATCTGAWIETNISLA